MPLDPRTPVLVGAGAVLQREEDPARALEPLELMVNALERAADDAGSRDLLARADSIRAPRGFWDYADPCRLLADRFGAKRAKTVVAEIGVLQTTLFGDAAQAIQAGEAEVVLIAGAEAKYRSLRAQISGAEAPLTQQPEGTRPDRVMRPAADIMHPLEIERGVVMPVQQYSMIENALRHAQGLSIDAHRREVAEMWAGFSQVAETNPLAWRSERVTPDAIREPSDRNRMLAFPYTKLHNSQWNVDQAAGLILCSQEAARAAGVPQDRWVFPLAVADSNHMLALIEREWQQRCPGFQIAGRTALGRAGLEPEALGPIELYSCFPVAVRVQAFELGIDLARPLTVCGGMAFAGGPLNNFVLQAAVRMMERLREEPGAVGMLNAVSGILTKQGVSLWSTEPPRERFYFDDVSAEVRRAVPTLAVDESYEGPATIASYTVLYGSDGPLRGAAMCDAPGGRRSLAVTDDAALARAMTEEEFVGRAVVVGAGGALRLPG